jgi:hypothetical protein
MTEFRQAWMPYALAKVDDSDGGWIVLNRFYKPLGGSPREHYDYSLVPKESRIACIHRSTAEFLSWKPLDAESEAIIFLYSDSCVPTGSAADWKTYSDKLEKLSSLKLCL